MTPRDPTAAEERMMRAIVRWHRSKNGPRHVETAAEKGLAKIAEEILAGTEVGVLG